MMALAPGATLKASSVAFPGIYCTYSVLLLARVLINSLDITSGKMEKLNLVIEYLNIKLVKYIYLLC